MKLGKNRIFLLIIATIFLSATMPRSLASDLPIVRVYPQQNSVMVGQTFTVDINVENVSGLQGFDFCLKYPTTLLNVSKVEEGSFMASFGSTFVAKLEIEVDYQIYRGRVWLAVVICEDGFADGSGTLATITFDAIAPGEEELDLFSVSPYMSDQLKLVTCGPEPIPHAVSDGYVIVSMGDPPDDPPDDTPILPEAANPDLNGDGKINIIDIVIVGIAYGASNGDPDYNPNADMDQNGVINIVDVSMVSAVFGEIL